MAAYTTLGIARAWSAAFLHDRALKAWAEQHFTRPFSVSIGADMRRPPNEDEAPFIAIFPDAVSSPDDRARNRHELGLVVGISDDGWQETGEGGREMRGLIRLDELWPLLRRVMDFALPGAVPQDASVEYELVEFPLLMLLITATVEQRLPIGGRL